MKNPVLNNIVECTKNALTAAYGYCGVASADNMAMLNSSDKAGHDIIIKIEHKDS